jgi:uncharacterized membrane protein YbaN (DUF454 family)
MSLCHFVVLCSFCKWSMLIYFCALNTNSWKCLEKDPRWIYLSRLWKLLFALNLSKKRFPQKKNCVLSRLKIQKNHGRFFLLNSKCWRKSRWRISVVLFLKNFFQERPNYIKKSVMTQKSKMAAENLNGGENAISFWKIDWNATYRAHWTIFWCSSLSINPKKI